MNAPNSLTQDDRAILAIVETLEKYRSQFIDPSKFVVALDGVQDNTVHISAKNIATARRLLDDPEFSLPAYLQGTGLGLQIWVDGRLYSSDRPGSFILRGASMILSEVALSSRYVRQNLGITELLMSKGTVSIHRTDRDAGYTAIAILPRFNNPAVLCRPVEALVGLPAMAATGAIGFAKNQAITQAIESSDGKGLAHYEYFWDGLDWAFTVKAYRQFYNDESEVVIITEPATHELVLRDSLYWEAKMGIR